MTVSNPRVSARIASLRFTIAAPLAASAAFAAVLASSSPASAQTAAAQPAAAPTNCPPDSWFCSDAPAPPAAAQPAPTQLQTLPDPEARPAPTVIVTQPTGTPPPVVVYQPAPPIMVVQPRSDVPPRYPYKARPAPWQRQREWGMNLHLSGVALGSKASSRASMGGLGLGLRYKPSPFAGVEANVDFYGGHDYNGYQRNETAFSFNGLVFVNPRSKAQVYFLGGIGFTSARVEDDSYGYSRSKYSYFGGQVGVGLELRLAKHFALNADVRGFIRGRTDDRAAYSPEFRDDRGRTTNVAGGGLFTGGMTFYF